MVDWSEYTKQNLAIIEAQKLTNLLLAQLQPQKVLEIGCNVGHNMAFLVKSQCHGIDTNQSALDEGKKLYSHIKFWNCQAHKLPFDNDFFDIVFVSGVLTHVDDRLCEKIILEMERTSKKFVMIIDYFGKGKKPWRDDYVRLRDYEQICHKLGMKKILRRKMPDLQSLPMECLICLKQSA